HLAWPPAVDGGFADPGSGGDRLDRDGLQRALGQQPQHRLDDRLIGAGAAGAAGRPGTWSHRGHPVSLYGHGPAPAPATPSPARTSVARPNSTNPTCSHRRRPNRSPSTPKVKSRPAKTSVYELTAHSSSTCWAPSPSTGSASTRRATFKMVLSSTTTSRLTTSTPRISHHRGCPWSKPDWSNSDRVPTGSAMPPGYGSQFRNGTVSFRNVRTLTRPALPAPGRRRTRWSTHGRKPGPCRRARPRVPRPSAASPQRPARPR